ncbi:MAG: hypothetical protein AAGD25_35780 [Cyanobacteria bacterium P01_F01_bin.150]
MKSRTIAFIHLGDVHEDLELIRQTIEQTENIKTLSLHLDDVLQMSREEIKKIDLFSLRDCRGYHLNDDFAEKLHGLVDLISIERNDDSRDSLVNSLAIARAGLDKSIYMRYLQEIGIAVIPCKWLGLFYGDCAESIVAVLKDLGWHDAVIKPTIASKSWHTYRIKKVNSNEFLISSSTDEMVVDNPDLFLRECLLDTSIFIQKFIPDIFQGGETSFIFIDGCYSHSIKKTVSADNWIAHEAFGGQNILKQSSATDVQWASNVSETLQSQYGYFAYARIDCIHSRNHGPLLLECELVVPRLFLKEAGAIEHYASFLIEKASLDWTRSHPNLKC